MTEAEDMASPGVGSDFPVRGAERALRRTDALSLRADPEGVPPGRRASRDRGAIRRSALGNDDESLCEALAPQIEPLSARDRAGLAALLEKTL